MGRERITFIRRNKKFLSGTRNLLAKCNTFVKEPKCFTNKCKDTFLWEPNTFAGTNAKFLSETILLWEWTQCFLVECKLSLGNAILLQEWSQFLSGTQFFAKEHKCFASKHKVSLGNATFLQEQMQTKVNATFLSEKYKSFAS